MQEEQPRVRTDVEGAFSEEVAFKLSCEEKDLSRRREGERVQAVKILVQKKGGIESPNCENICPEGRERVQAMNMP